MNNWKKLLCAALAICLLLSMTACLPFFGGNSKYDEYCGSYKYAWSGMLMYGFEQGDGKMRDYEIVLESGGSGTYREDSITVPIKWTCTDDGSITIEKRSLFGGTLTGTINGKELHVYDGDLDDSFTVEYMFIKQD